MIKETVLFSNLKPHSSLSPTITLSIILASFSVLTTSVIATPYMMAAMVSYFILLIGLQFRKKNVRVHATLMSTGILIDLSLVLILESQRNAIDTALAFSMTPLQQAHIGASSIATILYFPVFILGIMRLKSKTLSPSTKTWHKRLGISAFFFRTIGLLLMFTLLGR